MKRGCDTNENSRMSEKKEHGGFNTPEFATFPPDSQPSPLHTILRGGCVKIIHVFAMPKEGVSALQI